MERETEVARIPVRATRALIADALIAAGLPQPDAARCAELMSEADLTGADGHG
jgi:L-2-hydroxycarboxylate dehydrogenase (NAD+)